MKTRFDVIRRPLVTEKLDRAREANHQVAFEVDRAASKPEIRDAVERLFGVKVTAVRTLIRRGKDVRRGTTMGRMPDTKKAFITLAEGERIELFEGTA